MALKLFPELAVSAFCRASWMRLETPASAECTTSGR